MPQTKILLKVVVVILLALSSGGLASLAIIAGLAQAQGSSTLDIRKGGPTAAVAGDQIIYTLTITNNDVVPITNLVITDVIPSGATYVGGGTRVKNTVSWLLPVVAAGASEQVNYGVTATQTITNSVYGVAASGWGTSEVSKFGASDGAEYEYFGYSLALSGETAIVGVYGDDNNGFFDSGSAYIFVWDGTVWNEQAKLTPTDEADYNQFGYSVALSGDTALIGAYGDNDNGDYSGSAYVFVRQGTTWTQQTKLVAGDGNAYDFFGYSVALSGDTALIGAYEADSNDVNAGSAYVFVRDGVDWHEQVTLTANNGQAYDNFGVSVALSGDTAIVGSSQNDSNGVEDNGSAYVFGRNGTSWSQQAELTASDGQDYDNFGYSVAVDGDTAIIGAGGDDHSGFEDIGSAYVFERTGAVWRQQAKLAAHDSEAYDSFGSSVAINNDTVIIGAYGDSSNGNNSGSAYIFGRNQNGWVQQARLTPSDGETEDLFGSSVAISGDTVLVGAYGDNGNGFYAGSAYFFARTPGPYASAAGTETVVTFIPHVLNDSPTILGNATTLTASLTTATDAVYTWDFGDGETGSGAVVSHTYSGEGIYEAVVTATWQVEAEAFTTTAATPVLIETPITGLVVNHNSPTELNEVTTLTATIAAGSNVTYTWDLGDGFLAAGSVVTHNYPVSGPYTAVVTASNVAGLESMTTTVIVIEPLREITVANNGPTTTGQPATLTASAVVTTALFFEDFETIEDFGNGLGYPGDLENFPRYIWNEDPEGWSLTGPDSNCSPPWPNYSTVVHFGDSNCNYASASSGDHSLQMAESVALPASGAALLSFWSYTDPSCGSGGGQSYHPPTKTIGLASPLVDVLNQGGCNIDDQIWIDVVTDEAGDWHELAELDHTQRGWQRHTLSLAAYQGQNIRIRFRFEVNSNWENGLGWMVDNVAILGLAPVVSSNGITYTWAFGDGEEVSSNEAVITHPYQTAGVYTALITASSSTRVVTATTLVTVQQAITNLLVTHNSPTMMGQLTTLTATITAGTDVTYTWALGDGQTAQGAVVSHTYPAIGVYTAVVTTSNLVSLVTETTEINITDQTIAGLVAVNNGPTELGHPTTLTATITAGTNVTYTWAFGDGQNGSGPVITHTYSTPGSYTAIVTASNPVNLVSTSTTVAIPGQVDAGRSQVTLMGSSTAAADGMDSVTVQVTARDVSDSPVAGATVILTSTDPVNLPPALITNAAGQATAAVTSTQVGLVQIGAVVNSIPVSQTITATFKGAELNVAKSAPPQVTAGNPITYYIAVANNGLLTATNVVVTDTLPAGVEFFSSSGSYSYTQTGNQLVWQLGNLGPGQNSGSFSLTGMVSLTAPTSLINQVTVAASETELDLSDNSQSISTIVIPPTPLLMVSPGYPTLPIIQGQSGSLVIIVRNDGTGIMTDTAVVLPSTWPAWVAVRQTVLGDILPGQAVTFTVTAEANGVTQRGHYRDVITVQAAHLSPEYALLDVLVEGPTRRDVELTVTNNGGTVMAGASVILAEDILVVTEGQSAIEKYYRQGITDQHGRLSFLNLEAEKEYSLTITAHNHEDFTGPVTVSSDTGIQRVNRSLIALPALTVSPERLEFGLARGSLSQQELILRNPGALTLTHISLANPANIPWVYLSQPPAGAVIPPGGALTVLVNAAPPTGTLTATQFIDTIEVTASGNTSARTTLDITLNDGLTRTLCINVQTEVNGPLTDGLVRLVDQTGQVVFNGGITETVQSSLTKSLDSNGQTCFSGLQPGNYLATVGRGEQKLGEKGIEVVPGAGNQDETIIVDEPSIIVNWSVTPTTIEDVYTTVMTMTFVPEEKPALTLTPRHISLCEAGANGVVSEIVRIHNFYPVTFTLPVLELETLGNVQATITTTTASAFSVLSNSKTTLPLSDIPPGATVELALHAGFKENPSQCMDGDAGAILLKLSANYVHYTPNYAWYGGATITPTLIPLSQTTTIPLKLTNSGYPNDANLNSPPPGMQHISLSQPQNLSWITITPTQIISLPVDEEVDLTLKVTPPQWLAHGTYYDEIWVRATNGITGLIGIKAEMSDTGLRVETQLVTALFSNAGGTSPAQTSTAGGLSALRAPGLAYPLHYIPPGQISGDPQVSFWSNLVVTQNRHVGPVVDIFSEVWTLQALNCDCSAPGEPPKAHPTWSRIGNQLIAVQIGPPSLPGNGGAFAPEFKDNLVILRVTQRYALEREAFNAQLDLINGTAASITDLQVEITITDEGGAPVLIRRPGEPVTPTQTITPNFPDNSLIPTSTMAVNIPSNWAENGDASFIIIPETPTDLPHLGPAGAGSDRHMAGWTIVPDAFGITSPFGKNYFVYATIRYNGNKTIVTTKEMITVQPQPKVLLDYFIPRYVFANQPFDWQVIATNVGYGPANKFSMDQPKIEILKQSDKYPTNFTVGGPATLNFEILKPGQQVTGTWQITADHNGYFASIEASCQHQNYQGVELPPLIYCKPTIHIIENTPPDDASQWGKNSACTLGSWQAFDSDPVNTYSGNFTISHLDVSIPTWGLPLAFERTYNSRDPEDGPLGWGWTHNYHVELIRETYIPAVNLPFGSLSGTNGGSGSSGSSSGTTESSSPSLVKTAHIGQIATPPGLTLFGEAQDIMTVRLPHGSRAYFEIRDNGDTFVPFPGVKAELVRHLDVYTLTLPQEHTVYIFNADQKLAYLEDKNGNRLTFGYSEAVVPSEQRLLSVTDPSGRSLTFAYDSNRHMIRLTDPLSRTMNFGYSRGYLTSATDFRGQTTTYAYTPPSEDPATGETQPGQLTTLTDANGHIEVTNHYNDDRRVDWQRDAENNLTTFSYVTDGSTGGQITTTTDPHGHVTIDRYNDKGQIIRQTDTFGFFEQYEYDANYNMTRRIDKKGRETRYDWNDCGCDYQLVTDPMGFTTAMTYDSQHQLTSLTDERGFVTTMTYDSRSNPLTVRDPLAGTIQYSYGLRGELLSKTDENNQTTFFGYDFYGNTTVITDALGQVTRMGYDQAGRLLTTTDALGRVTGYTYDPGDNLLQLIDPLTGMTNLTYDNVGNRLTTTDALNRATRFAYDARNNLTQVTNALGGTHTFVYDSSRNLIAETNPNGQTTRYQYDGLNRILTTTNALSGTLSYTYDAVGNRLTEQDPNGNITSYGYDANDRIQQTIYPDASEMTAVYDQADNLLSLTDGENRTISYAYDALGRVTIMTDPITGTVIYSYDAAGNQLAVTDAAGRTSTFTYDALDRPTRVTDPLSGVTESAYDAVGNVTSLTDAEGRTTSFAYDALNRVIRATDPLSGTSHYSYDAVGNQLQTVDPLGRATRSAYDALNRLTTVTNPLSGITTYHYDAVGNLTSWTDAEGRTTTTSYDALNRPIETTAPVSSHPGTGGTMTYTYDANGNLLSQTDREGRTTRYTYDAFNQIVSVMDAEGGLTSLAYDRVGNLTRATDTEGRTTQFSYDALDRRIAVRDPLSNIIQYTYDSVGNRLTETDQEGRTTRYFYDARDRLVTIRDAFNHDLSYSYDAVDNPIRIIDPEGHESRYVYDALDRLIATTDALSQTTTYLYDAVGNQLSITDAKDRTITYQYDALDRLVAITDPLNQTTVFTYSLVGNLLQTQNPRLSNGQSQIQNFEYDALDRLVQVIDALNQSTRYSYDRMGNQISLTDANNRTTTLAYDGLNRLVQMTNPLGGTTSYSYDRAGNLIQTQNPRLSDGQSQIVNYEYDSLDRLIKVIDPLNQVTEFGYDKVGNQIELIDPLRRTTRYRYDLLNRLTEVEDAAHNITGYTYNKIGYQTTVTDAEGRITTTVYDALYRPIEVTNPLSGTTRFTYDEVGNVLQIQNPKSQFQNFEYDALDRLIVAADALTGTTTYSYDAVGNVIRISNPKSQLSTFEYDALNRLTRVTDPLSGVTGYEYDPVGNLIRQVDPLDNEVVYTFDALDRVTQVRDVLNQTTGFAYDAIGNLTQLTDAKGQVTTYQYDALNRLVAVSDPLNQTTQFEYDVIGNATAVVDPLNRRLEYDYDVLDRLVGVTDPLNRSTTYQYDRVGNQIGIIDAAGVTTRYEYDPLDRLTVVTQNSVNGGPANANTNVTTRFEYDPLGNLTQIIDPRGHAQTFDYDPLNRLVAKRGALLNETTYIYDAIGNLTQISDAKSQISNLQYDALNRLTSLTRPDETVNFTYDAVGNRLSMTDPTGTTTYEYDDLYRLTQVSHPSTVPLGGSTLGGQPASVSYTYDTKGNRTGLTYPDGSQVNYNYDAADRLIQVEDWASGLTTYNYDAAGQLTRMALPNGVSSTYSYDTSGQLTLLQHQNLTQTLASYAYSYDDVGNRVQAVESVVSPIFTPTAVFTATPLAGLAPLTVTFFHDPANALAHTWDFGNGITQTMVITTPRSGGSEGSLTTTHVYTQPGLYTVTLVAQNGQASHSFTRTNYIAVISPDAFQEENGQVIIEAENFDQQINGLTHSWLRRTNLPGYTGTSYLQPLPDVDALYQANALTGSPQVDYPISFTTPGTYTVWVRGYASNAAGDSLYLGLRESNGPAQNSQIVSLTGFSRDGWRWARISTGGQSALLTVPAPGSYTLTLWMREDGLRVDRLLLITDTNYIPSGDGPAESPRTGENFRVSVVPASSAQEAIIVHAQESRGAEVHGSNLLVHNSELKAPSGQFISSSLRFAASPFGQDPTLLLLGPLSAAAPLAGRRKWRRSAWLILLILLSLGLLVTSTALAADMTTADHHSPTAKMTADYRPVAVDAGYTPPVSRVLASSLPTSLPQFQGEMAAATITTTYNYDPLYRLTGANSSDGGSFGYTYDAAGNRLTYTLNDTQVATYTYNAANWLTQAAVNGQPSAVVYSYDANGNLLNDGTYTYGYDSANRLTQIASLLSITNFVYNGDGVRVAQIENGLRSDYVQDVALPLPQVLTAQQGGTASKYLRGLGLIGEQVGGSGPLAGPAVWQYDLPDALGSVRQITDLTGQVLLTRRYDPFGGLQSQTGIGRSAYGFAGEEQDPESNQLFLRARTYNPSTGRFLQSDPVMGTPADPRTLHHYTYAFNNPINYTDPSGLMPPWSGQPGRQTNTWIGPGSYAPDPPTQGGSGYVQLLGPRAPKRSVNESGGEGWYTHSDPHARQQSQGFRQGPCGIGSLLVNIRDGGRSMMSLVKIEVDSFAHDPTGRTAQRLTELWNWTQENVQKSWQQIRQNNRRHWQSLQQGWEEFKHNPSGVASELWQESRTEISLVLDFIPIIGDIKSIIESAVGFDLAGNELSQTERSLMLAGGIVGMFTVFDEIVDAARLGSKLLDNSDEVADLLRAGKGLDKVDEVADAGRAINQANNLADTLKTGRGLDNLAEAADVTRPNYQLDSLDDLIGERRVFNQEETRRALSGASDGGLSRGLDEVRVVRQAMDEAAVKSRLLELHQNHNILREREAKFGGSIGAPLDLFNQIVDHERAIELAEKARAGKISFNELIDKTNHLRLDVSFNKWIDETLLTPSDFNTVLERLRQNHNILRGREVKFGGFAPLPLLNQIADHEHAIELAMEGRAHQASVQEFIQETRSLLLEVPSVSIHKRPLNTPDDFNAVLGRLHQNHNILREREAKFGGFAPLPLLNQITDHERAIELAEKAQAGKISIQEFIERINLLILDY